jgi:hypothetical protein
MTKDEISVGSGLKAIIEDLLHCPAVELVVNGAIGGGNGVGNGFVLTWYEEDVGKYFRLIS